VPWWAVLWGLSWVPVSVPLRRRPEEPSTRSKANPLAARSGAAEVFTTSFHEKGPASPPGLVFVSKLRETIRT
jgi:hypothetical protein